MQFHVSVLYWVDLEATNLIVVSLGLCKYRISLKVANPSHITIPLIVIALCDLVVSMVEPTLESWGKYT